MMTGELTPNGTKESDLKAKCYDFGKEDALDRVGPSYTRIVLLAGVQCAVPYRTLRYAYDEGYRAGMEDLNGAIKG